jgi:hypothetical protein
MSYSRWSNSCWYAFYNVNGCLSLWYDLDHTIDLTHEECEIIDKDKLIEIYGCSPKEATEALEYVAIFLENYTG